MNSDILNPQPKSITLAEYQQTMQELHEAFDKAETKTNLVQNTLNQVPLPSINQLRYAGFHISKTLATVRILDNGYVEINVNELLSAYKHCLRAYYDALDYSAIIIRGAFDDIETEYNKLLIPLEDCFTEYHVWRTEINNLGRISSLSEENELIEIARTRSKREEYYAKLDAKIDMVIKIYDHLPLMADRLSLEAKKLAKQEVKEQKQEDLDSKNLSISQKNFKIVFWTFVVSVIALVVSTIISLFKD